MARIVKKHFKFALFLVLALAGVASAEIKLRLYLKDGSLQAGNLVVETEKMFVILSKNGREEVSKEKIMFINGKPLSYWQDHPDKHYQTEIIPSEIPDPSYVNNKAALPSVVAIPKIESVVPPPSKPSTTRPPHPTPILNEQIDRPTTSALVPKQVEPQTKPIVDKTMVPAEKPVKIVSVPPTHEKMEPKDNSAQKTRAPSRKIRKRMKLAPPRESSPTVSKNLSREAMSDLHAQRAKDFISRGEPGHALQELHYSTVLNRQNAEAHLLIGKLYVEEGVGDRAVKYLTNHGLKKNDQAKNILEKITTEANIRLRSMWILFGSTAAGLISLLPLLMLLRRWRSKSRSITISADQMESTMANVSFGQRRPDFDQELKPLQKSVEEQKNLILEDIKKVAATNPAPIPTEQTESLPVTFENEDKLLKRMENSANDAPPIQPLVIAHDAGLISESIPITAETKKESPPPTQPAEPFIPQGKMDEKQTPEKELVRSVEPLENVVLAVEPSKRSMDELIKSREDFLNVSRTVDELVSKGHVHAGAGEIEAARKEYRTALALHPQSVEAILGLAYLCFIQENWEMTLEHYLHAVQINPKSADAHYGLGRVLLETNHVTEAVEEFRRTLNLDPTFYEARETLTALGVAV